MGRCTLVIIGDIVEDQLKISKDGSVVLHIFDTMQAGF